MSAFVVSDKHINSILSWANMYMLGGINLPDGEILEFSSTKDLQKMAKILLDENYRSVNKRYSRQVNSQKIVFCFTKILTPVEIVKACKCYNYQACESDDYSDSAAYRIIDWICDRAISLLPGYEQATWNIK